MKIFNILFEKNKDPYGHKLVPTGTDPETGAVSSKVEYTPLRRVKANLDSMNDNFIEAVRNHPNDPKLLELQQTFEKFKRDFNRHTNKVYGRI